MAKSKNEKGKKGKHWQSLLPVRITPKPGKSPGRKPAITPTVLERLREAFLIGCDDDEAALHAEISRATLYNYQKSNPAFLDWKEALKRNPFLKARKCIVDHLDRDPEFAMKYMERKKKAEFSPAAKLTIEDNRGVLDDEALAKGGDILTQHLERVAARKQANAKSDTAKPISSTH